VIDSLLHCRDRKISVEGTTGPKRSEPHYASSISPSTATTRPTATRSASATWAAAGWRRRRMRRTRSPSRSTTRSS